MQDRHRKWYHRWGQVTYDKGGNRISLQHDSSSVSAAYAYDSRDRCSGIDQYNGSAWVDLADYTWLGNALSQRETCPYRLFRTPCHTSTYDLTPPATWLCSASPSQGIRRL